MHAVPFEAPLQALLRLDADFLFRAAPRGGLEMRQDRFALPGTEGAAPRDLDGIGDRLGQVGKLRHHLGGGFEAVLAGEAAPVLLRNKGAVGDAEQRVVRLVHVLVAEMHVVGGDERELPGVGEIDQPVFRGAFGREPMALQLHVKPVREHLRELVEQRGGGFGLAAFDQLVERPAGPARERDQPVGMISQLRGRDVRPVARLDPEI